MSLDPESLLVLSARFELAARTFMRRWHRGVEWIGFGPLPSEAFDLLQYPGSGTRRILRRAVRGANAHALTELGPRYRYRGPPAWSLNNGAVWLPAEGRSGR